MSEDSYTAAMPSAPTAFGTVTEPIAVSEPSPFTRNSSTMPLAPVWVYRNRPSAEAEASTVPPSVGVVPSSVSPPPRLDRKPLSVALPAFET